jgi:hypothetical protein
MGPAKRQLRPAAAHRQRLTAHRRNCEGHASTRETSEWPTFLHLDIFDEEWSDLGLGDDDLQELQNVILASPERYPIVRGAGGLRKIRFAPSGQSRGKSGAYRVGYVRFREFGFILLVTVWGKNEKSDLSAKDRNGIAALVADIGRALRARGER